MTEQSPPTATPNRPFRQADWRNRVQSIVLVTVVVIGLFGVAALFVDESARASAAGRDVQRLIDERDQLIFENEFLRTEIAQAKSIWAIEQRAREMGFVPATVDNLDYLPLDEDLFAEPPPTVVEAPVGATLNLDAVYDETLGEWLMRNFDQIIQGE